MKSPIAPRTWRRSAWVFMLGATPAALAQVFLTAWLGLSREEAFAQGAALLGVMWGIGAACLWVAVLAREGRLRNWEAPKA